MKTSVRLGILVNSPRHPDYVLELARAARERNKRVLVHFTGEGTALIDHPGLQALSRYARVTLSDGAPAPAGNGGAPDETARCSLTAFLRRCDRYVVF